MDENNKPKTKSVKTIFEKAQKINQKTDQIWLKYLKWFWIIAGIYILYLIITGILD